MKSGEAATERLRPIFVCGQRMIVAVEIWFCAGNCVSLLYEDGNRKRMDMKTTQEYIQLLKEYKQKRGILYGISRIGIFGSVARGEQTEGSDVDVCVDLTVPSIFSLVHIKEELCQLFGCEVDVVRIRQNMDALLKRNIMEEGIYV